MATTCHALYYMLDVEKIQSMASRGHQKSKLQYIVISAADRGNHLMKKNSNIEILLSFSNVSGTMINAFTHCPTESAQEPYEVDTMVIPVLQMKKLKSRMVK